MLDSMRSLAKSFVAKALMIFLVISFAVWGVGDILRNRGSSYLVRVGDEHIAPGQFASEQRNMQRAMEQMGVQVDPRALEGEVLRRMVQERLVRQWQRDTGLAVDRDTLAAQVGQNIDFKGLDGKFSPKIFQEYLHQRQLTEAGYLAQLSEEIGGKAMLSSIDISDLHAPKSLLALSEAAGLQTRDAVLITIPPAPVAVSSISEDDIKDYYDQHSNLYEQPETRTIEYVTIDRASLEKLAPKDATPDAREQAVQEMSMQVEDALAGGSAMGEALAEAGVHAQSKMLDHITAEQFSGSKDALLRGVAEQGFQLGEGESSGLLNTDDGRYYMVSVKTVTAASPKPLAQVTGEVRQAVAREQARTETKARLAVLKQALAAGKNWKEAAAEVKGSAREVSNVARPVIGLDGKVKSSGPVPPLLQQAMFEHEVGSIAGPMLRENGEQVVALITGVHSQPAANRSGDVAAETEYKAQLGNETGNALFRELSNRYPVDVNEALLQQMRGSDAE